jgi:hypothetical protein
VQPDRLAPSAEQPLTTPSWLTPETQTQQQENLSLITPTLRRQLFCLLMTKMMRQTIFNLFLELLMTAQVPSKGTSKLVENLTTTTMQCLQLKVFQRKLAGTSKYLVLI